MGVSKFLAKACGLDEKRSFKMALIREFEKFRNSLENFGRLRPAKSFGVKSYEELDKLFLHNSRAKENLKQEIQKYQNTFFLWRWFIAILGNSELNKKSEALCYHETKQRLDKLSQVLENINTISPEEFEDEFEKFLSSLSQADKKALQSVLKLSGIDVEITYYTLKNKKWEIFSAAIGENSSDTTAIWKKQIENKLKRLQDYGREKTLVSNLSNEAFIKNYFGSEEAASLQRQKIANYKSHNTFVRSFLRYAMWWKYYNINSLIAGSSYYSAIKATKEVLEGKLSPSIAAGRFDLHDGYKDFAAPKLSMHLKTMYHLLKLYDQDNKAEKTYQKFQASPQKPITPPIDNSKAKYDKLCRDILGVKPYDSMTTIKKRYLKLALLTHIDRNRPDKSIKDPAEIEVAKEAANKVKYAAKEGFNILGVAYEYLKDKADAGTSNSPKRGLDSLTEKDLIVWGECKKILEEAKEITKHNSNSFHTSPSDKLDTKKAHTQNRVKVGKGYV